MIHRILFLCLLTLPVGAQLQLPREVDTLQLLRELSRLESTTDHTQYLLNIQQMDQQFRWEQEEPVNDAVNSFKLALYARRFPERITEDIYVDVLQIVLRHVPYRNLYRELFGAYWQAFQAGAVPEKTMRQLLIEERLGIGRYHSREEYEAYALPKAVRELGLNTDLPSVDRLWQFYQEGKRHSEKPKLKRVFYVEVDARGQALENRMPAMVYETPDGLVFLTTLRPNGQFSEGRQLLHDAGSMVVRPENRSPNGRVRVSEKEIIITGYGEKVQQRYRSAKEMKK